MTPFTSITAVAVPMNHPNIDTDAIIPSRAIRSVSRKGLGPGLFANRRYLSGGIEINPDFVLNRPEYAGAGILIGGENFGCGSSREQAVWALLDYGFRALIAPSYGSIFYRNCIYNGLLPVQLPQDRVEQLSRWVQESPAENLLCVDLQNQQVDWIGPEAEPPGEFTLVCEVLPRFPPPLPFSMADDARNMLLRGLDSVDLTLENIAEELHAFETQDRRARPWLHLDDEEDSRA